MKILKSSFIRTAIAVCLILIFAIPAEATTNSSNLSNQISDIYEQKKNTESNLNEANSKVDTLESAKSKLDIYLDDLNTQLTQMSDELAELGNKIIKKEDEITVTKQELEVAKVKEASQYMDMKMRIKFMYENGNTAYLELFLEADNLSDALNKAEYITKIYDYDREMLINYKKTKEEIYANNALLVQEQSELYSLQSNVESQQQKVAEIVASTSTKISAYSNEIADTEMKAKEYESKLSEQKNTIANLQKIQEEQKEAEEKAAAEKAEAEKSASINTSSSSNTSSSTNTATSSQINSLTPTSSGDVAMMAAIIQCEAGGESMEGKLAVGSVVMNRIRSGSYPNTVVGVIYQSGQFTPVASGRFALVLSQGANSSCTSAAQQVLNGYSSGSWLQFRTVNTLISGTIIGNNVFF
jgi:spore germination cell wall hydrolase CwlJ-like protein